MRRSITELDVKDSNLLVRTLREMEVDRGRLESRIAQLEGTPAPSAPTAAAPTPQQVTTDVINTTVSGGSGPSYQDINIQLQSGGSAPLDVSTLAGYSNLVTTNTAQTVTASKTFTGPLIGNTYNFELQSQHAQCFTLDITNNGGTLQHKVLADLFSTTLGNWATQISGASSVFANTPQVNNVTNFVSGAGVDAAATSQVVLNTAAQVAGDQMVQANIIYNDAGTVLTVGAGVYSLNVNGVTQVRLALAFKNASTGVVFPITTASIAAGKSILVTVMGYIK